MKLEANGLHYRATDLSTYSACQHSTLLEREVAGGRLERPHRNDPAKRLLEERGIEHEQRYRGVLEARHREPAFQVPGGIPKTPDRWREATQRTLSAMKDGHQVIYQAPLSEAGWHGLADFLVRVKHEEGEQNSELGDYHYEVVDTKLAQEARGSAILQLCVYSEIVGRLQRRPPEHLWVASPAGAMGRGESPSPREHRFRAADFLAYFRVIRERFEHFTSDGELEVTYPEPVEHCDVCAWWARCDRRRRDDDHLSLVAGMGRGHRKLLTEAGILTLEALGKLQLPMATRPSKLPRTSLERLQHQARLQLEARATGPRYETLPVETGRGLCLLPEPSPGDVFFDIEADRYAIDGTFYYLLGWVAADDAGAPTYRACWSNTRTEERDSFERFVDFAMQQRARYPKMHIYHFAPFEKTALADMMGRYASREDAVDDLFRNAVLVDLMPVVKQGLRAGVESYSLKELERFYGYERGTDLRAAAQARRLFELNREVGRAEARPEVVTTIEAYNREDCESTLHLQRFLEKEREALIVRGEDVPRPAREHEGPDEHLSAWLARVDSIRKQLLNGLPSEIEDRTAGENARQLLADVVDWHRRDAKPGWHEYFRLRELPAEELLDESSPIGELGTEDNKGRIPGKGSKSDRYEYAFPPQEYNIKPGDKVECPVTGQSLGEVIDIDRARNVVAVKRMKALEQPPRAMAKTNDEPNAKAHQGALAQIAEALAPDFGLSEGPGLLGTGGVAFPAARALLLRTSPRLEGGAALQIDGESAADAMKRVAPHLSGTVLAVQGPPGAGKTYAGSRMIVELVRAGKKVGITAASHKVIEHLLSGVHEAAKEARDGGEPLNLFSIQKPKSGAPQLEHPYNVKGKSSADVAASLAGGQAQVAAGTSWLWCDEKLRGAVDVLVVDEAGQFSLADALPVSVAADSLVLLGDPQQLSQPSQGSHPPGAGASALEHLLGDAATIPEGQGLFMEKTWRLPPKVADFTSEYFYSGRLQSHPDCVRQVLRAGSQGSTFAGAGIYFEPVVHQGNVHCCDEEADKITEILHGVLSSGATWIDRKGATHKLVLGDVLVVAPYNSQVQLITEKLHAAGYSDARVGTVDKFQGQEAPVVFYSMATSSPEDAPKGFDFLFSLNRLNVATSRAQAIVIVVASPRLLEAECRTPKQMRLVNAFCGAVEHGRGTQRRP